MLQPVGIDKPHVSTPGRGRRYELRGNPYKTDVGWKMNNAIGCTCPHRDATTMLSLFLFGL
jgi:hypothetical protein